MNRRRFSLFDASARSGIGDSVVRRASGAAGAVEAGFELEGSPLAPPRDDVAAANLATVWRIRDESRAAAEQLLMESQRDLRARGGE
jgi:hypothetical protein